MCLHYDMIFKTDLEYLRHEVGNIIKEIVVTSDSAERANLEDEKQILRSVRKLVSRALELLYSIKFDLED